MNKPVVCVLSALPKQSLMKLLHEKCSSAIAELIYIDVKNIELHVPDLQRAEVILSDPAFHKHWLDGLPNLKFVQSTFAGVNEILSNLKPDHTPSFTLCRFGGVFGAQMSEYVISNMIGFERAAKTTISAQRDRLWSTEVQHYIWWNSRRLDEMTLGILGLGDIGHQVAKVCKWFGLRIIGMVNQVPAEKSPYVDEYKTQPQLLEVLSESDYVCNILPSTPLTRGMLDKQVLKACAKKQSVFMNVGRGDICSEDSILEALDENWLRGAILDVFSTEPLPSSSPLWNHNKVTITPHVAAVTIPEQIVDHFKNSLECYMRNETQEYQVDWKKGY